MVRTPCCEKMGLKKGPWTPEEDRILISHIQRHGHGNWRALPKQAGLLRCGKSCRLRWINYLRPDIKRGKFSKEEVETILKLHGILGNKWSAIAARLPGRTDNEIKNFWHTHLKKSERSISEVQYGSINNNSNTSLYPLQETQATSSSSGVDASGAIGFYGTVSSDISGEVAVGSSNAQYNEIGKEMEFWYNLFVSSHQKGMET